MRSLSRRFRVAAGTYAHALDLAQCSEFCVGSLSSSAYIRTKLMHCHQRVRKFGETLLLNHHSDIASVQIVFMIPVTCRTLQMCNVVKRSSLVNRWNNRVGKNKRYSKQTGPLVYGCCV